MAQAGTQEKKEAITFHSGLDFKVVYVQFSLYSKCARISKIWRNSNPQDILEIFGTLLKICPKSLQSLLIWHWCSVCFQIWTKCFKFSISGKFNDIFRFRFIVGRVTSRWDKNLHSFDVCSNKKVENVQGCSTFFPKRSSHLLYLLRVIIAVKRV